MANKFTMPYKSYLTADGAVIPPSDTPRVVNREFTDREIYSGSFTREQSLSLLELGVDTADIVLKPDLNVPHFVPEHEPFDTRRQYAVDDLCERNRKLYRCTTAHTGAWNSNHFALVSDEVYLPKYTRDGLRWYGKEENPFETVESDAEIAQEINGTRVATWKIRNVERVDKEKYRVSGMSPVGAFLNKTHYGGMYPNSSISNATDLIADIFGAPTYAKASRNVVIEKGAYFCCNTDNTIANLFRATARIPKNTSITPGTNCVFVIEKVFRTIGVSQWLPIATARDNLKQVLFMLGASLQVDADGTIKIQNLYTTEQPEIGASIVYQAGARVKYDKPVSKVTVVEHQFISGTESKELFTGSGLDHQIITFSEPIGSLDHGEFTLHRSNANFAEISGSGTLTGIPYIHRTYEVTQIVDANVEENEVRVEKATLIGQNLSMNKAQRLAEYFAHRNKITLAVARDTLKAGTVAKIIDPWDDVLKTACVESEQVNISGVTKTIISAVPGYIPPRATSVEDVYDVITAGSSYTFPADLPDGTPVSVWLIGGGQAGYDGKNGTVGQSKSIYIAKGRSDSFTGGKGGSGGAAGAAGKGGKIKRIDITANHSETVVISIGEGGTSNGAYGGATTWGSYSSASGSYADNGFYDSHNNKTYALPGVNGVFGGDGGDGANPTSSGSSGAPAGDGTPGGKGGKGDSYEEWGGDIFSSGGGGGSGGAKNTTGANANLAGGAAGRDAPPPASLSETAYGCGGNGGNGGSGGGGCGGRSFERHYFGDEQSALTLSSVGGRYGLGSAGTAGIQGCIIVAYRKEVS